MKRLMILTVSIIAACFLNTACSGKKSGGPTVTIHGKLDGSTVIAFRENFSFKKILAVLLPAKAHAAVTTPVVTRVLAVRSDLKVTSVTPAADGSFSLSVESGNTYVLVFLNGLSVVGVYEFDSETGLDSAPLPQASGDLNLQTVSYDAGSGRLTGSTGQDIVLQALGLDLATASAFGIMDDAMLRFSSVDVDGNGTIDIEEGKRYSFELAYNFTDSLSAITQGDLSSGATMSFTGYRYAFSFSPPDPAITDWSLVSLTSPTAINGHMTAAGCYGDQFPDKTYIEFYCGGSAVDPRTPPAGTYLVTIGPATYTFNNVRSQPVDANLNNIYIPLVKLTMSGGKVTRIDYEFWKRLNEGTWVHPNDHELQALLVSGDYTIATSDWNDVDRVNGALTITATGTIIPPAQTFTPSAFHMYYEDKAGYGYHFDWR